MKAIAAVLIITLLSCSPSKKIRQTDTITDSGDTIRHNKHGMFLITKEGEVKSIFRYVDCCESKFDQ